jgi:hypothetical protein
MPLAGQRTLNRRIRYPPRPALSGQPINPGQTWPADAAPLQAWCLEDGHRGGGIVCGSDIPLCIVLHNSEWVGGAGNAQGAPIEDVGLDHGGLQVAVAQKLLKGVDVLVAFKQVHRQGPQDSQHRCTDPVGVAVGVLTVTAGISPWRFPSNEPEIWRWSFGWSVLTSRPTSAPRWRHQ